MKFESGSLMITPGALEKLNAMDWLCALMQHHEGDWGDCDKEDWQLNNLALKEGTRLFSVYHDRHGTKYWIITEADRSVTTILLPEEY